MALSERHNNRGRASHPGRGRPVWPVEALADAGIKDVLVLRDAFQAILGRPVDLVTYAGLRDGLDDDIRREAVLL